MKNFIKEYLNIIAYAIIGLMFIVASFYLIMNYYHSEEVKTTIYVSENNLDYQNYKEKIANISSNLNRFKNKKSKDTTLNVIYNKLSSCNTVLQTEGTLAKIPVNYYFSAKEVYDLGAKFQNDLLNICWALQLSYLTEENIDSRFKVISPYIKNSINSISNQVNFAIAEIQNNSSYFYTTGVTSATVRNYLASDFSIIANAYNDFADIVLALSEQINNYSDNGGQNDQNIE